LSCRSNLVLVQVEF